MKPTTVATKLITATSEPTTAATKLETAATKPITTATKAAMLVTSWTRLQKPETTVFRQCGIWFWR
ncbi:hypothetical protein [Paenibacillus sp. 7523-1]|uniref:hypothetical protein n=1 Tax=Paenibacillus sp. 7523-1 TaxID=2022550 RepID=UPI0020D1B181|nr:hypothetical protein [Paenibacillus sp. 7523-1]